MNAPALDTAPALFLKSTVYEELLAAFQSQNGGGASFFQEASQLTRQNHPAATDREKALVNAAAGVAGPVLTSYVHWVLCRAREQGLHKLYFVSREGQILLRIAQRLNHELKIPIELRYLYGGRQAWHLPGTFDFAEDEMQWLFYAPHYLTPRSLFERLQIRPEEIAQVLERAGFKRGQWNSNLTKTQIIRLQEVVLSLELRRILLEKAAIARKVLSAYLKQEGVFDLVPWGLVDLGWLGRMQNSLGKVLKCEGALMPAGFYFALWPQAYRDTFGEKHAYYCDGRKNDGPNRLSVPVVTWLEIFAAADHGVVMGYEKRAARLWPVLKEECNVEAIGWGLPLVQKTIETFAENCAKDLACAANTVDFQPMAETLLKQWTENPSLPEVLAWGSFRFETDQTGAYRFPVARKLGWRDALQKFLGKPIVDLGYLSWPAGCWSLTSKEIRWVLKAVEKAGGILKRLQTQTESRLEAIVQWARSFKWLARALLYDGHVFWARLQFAQSAQLSTRDEQNTSRRAVHLVYFSCRRDLKYLKDSLRSLCKLKVGTLGNVYCYTDRHNLLTKAEKESVAECYSKKIVFRTLPYTMSWGGINVLLNEITAFKEISQEMDNDDFLAKIDSDILFISPEIFNKVSKTPFLALGHPTTNNFANSKFLWMQGGGYFLHRALLKDLTKQFLLPAILKSKRITGESLLEIPEDAAMTRLVEQLTPKVSLESFQAYWDLSALDQICEAIDREREQLSLIHVHEKIRCFWDALYHRYV